MHALPARQLHVGETTIGLHDQKIAGEFIAPQAPFEVAEILTHLRTDIGIGSHGRSPFVFAVLPRQLMGRADKQIGIRFAQYIAHADFMLWSAVRVKKQHGHRLKAFFLYNARHLARLLFVKRRAHRAVGEHPFGHLEDILPRHQRAMFGSAG